MKHTLQRFGPPLALAWILAAAGAGARPAEKDELIVVIANGSGLTAEEALADAFRDAVRQAVGVLVDAQTRIKNDELIEDKVLTLSNGFVKTYDKKRERKEGGLVKIRIEARVERGKLLDKLTEFKITRTEVDGLAEKVKGLTRAEIKKQATDLLKESLRGLPRVLVAEANKDLSPDGKGECVVRVKVRADRKRYQTYLETMKRILQEASEARDSVPARQAVHPEHRAVRVVQGTKAVRETRLGGSPAAEGLVIWMQAPTEAGAKLSRLDGYAVRLDSTDILDALKGKLLVRVRLLDKEDRAIVEDEFEPNWSTQTRVPDFINGGERVLTQADPGARWLWGVARADQCHLFVAPGIVTRPGMLGVGFGAGRGLGLWLVPEEVTYRRPLAVTNEELGRLKAIECTPIFKPAD